MRFKTILLPLSSVLAFLVAAQAQAGLIEITQRHLVNSVVTADESDPSNTTTEQYQFHKMDYEGTLQAASMNYTSFAEIGHDTDNDLSPRTIDGVDISGDQIFTTDEGAYSASVQATITQTFRSNLVSEGQDGLTLENILNAACSGSNSTASGCNAYAVDAQDPVPELGEVNDFTAAQLGSLIDMTGGGSFMVDLEHSLGLNITNNNSDPFSNALSRMAGYLSLSYYVDIDCDLGLCPEFSDSESMTIRAVDGIPATATTPEPASGILFLLGMLALGGQRALGQRT